MPDAASTVVNQTRQSDEVLDRFRQGDVDAFEVVFREHQRIVYSWILRIVRDPPTAEDLTVETFWRIYRAHARFDPARGFAPWARRVATRAALDYLRTRRRETELTVETPAVAGPEPGIRAEMRSRIAQAMARLPAPLRVAALLALIEEQPHRQIADALGISVAAVKVRVFRAMRFLRKDLERQGIRP